MRCALVSPKVSPNKPATWEVQIRHSLIVSVIFSALLYLFFCRRQYVFHSKGICSICIAYFELHIRDNLLSSEYSIKITFKICAFAFCLVYIGLKVLVHTIVIYYKHSQ
jgi:hypothetical protein